MGIEHYEVILVPVKELTADSKKSNVQCVGIRPNPIENTCLGDGMERKDDKTFLA